MSQTGDLFSSSVVLDTSVLHGAGVSSAPFQVLKGLVEAGLVRVLIPQLALEEFRTQWRERHLGSAAQTQKALKALSGEAVLPGALIKDAGNLTSGLENINWEERSHHFASKYMQENGFEVLPLTIEQCSQAWADYFRGKLPSKKTKHRSDLPDDHIIAAVMDFAGIEGKVSFVSADIGQREAASNIDGVECFENIEGLVRSPKLQSFQLKWHADQKWQLLHKSLPFEEITGKVEAFIEANGGDLLSSNEVTDPAIPEDNHTAWISMYDEPAKTSVVGPEDWGGGLLRYQATFFSECLLSWAIYKGDAYHLPEWVSVSGERNDHYFEAEGYATVMASVDITVKLRVQDDEQGPAGSIADISFEDSSFELSLSEHS